MRAIPLDVLLSFPQPNYVNPDTRGPALAIVNYIFLVLVIVVVALRIYTRLIVKRWFGTDDVFMALALIFAIGLKTVVLLANQRYGWDRHVYDIPLDWIASTAKIAMAAKILFTCAASFTRLSLLFFYYRLVKDTDKKWFHWSIHANVAFTIGIFISFICLAIFQCKPISNYWSPPNTCMDEGVVTLIAGILNCIADLFCTILPIPLVARLEMPQRQRIAVVILFSFGFIVTIAGIVRTWYIYKSLIEEYDITWYSYPLWIAAAVEIDLGVICASAPVLRPLLSKLPFTVSSIASRISAHKASSKGYTANTSADGDDSNGTTPAGSQNKSALDSKRRSGRMAMFGGKLREEHELQDLNDVERGKPRGKPSTESQDAILDNVRRQNLRWQTKHPLTAVENSNELSGAGGSALHGIMGGERSFQTVGAVHQAR
ncbi:hypothetical protein BU24DRAFT_439026 [Aaosphaeria arxii CBS 175.79]|uniref:Rhodopsin domain-containing protein n=1 Tax=Aaosphaeria arxii CBS 175.79 TaxID=1450172 RepID=A0A6A5YB79_9PLEO|nr:uncharacterized protein BU24DRAFT_439026 [Aaosphaeria arxii CBS 175.79]KAF2022287.1 hypothetical protein BU24DRAFT_439026 [Aaosphaeria arxii CBS 175.79]